MNVGICGSDVHYWHNGRCGPFVVKKPMILGHETSAEVVAVGSNVKHLQVGDRVATEPATPCGNCEFCRGGKYNLCPDIICHATPPYDGTLVNYFLHSAAYAFKLPETVDNEAGAMLEPLSVAIHSCKRSGVTVGSKVFITGAGPIGILGLMAAKAYGATKIVITDLNEERLKLAKKLGATETIQVLKDVSEEEMLQKVIDAFDGERPEITFECSGAAPSIRLMLLATKSGGTAIQIGMTPENVSLPIAQAAAREVTLLGAFRYKDCFPTAVDMAASGKLDLSQLVSHRFDFQESQEAFQVAKAGTGMKVMIKVAD